MSSEGILVIGMITNQPVLDDHLEAKEALGLFWNRKVKGVDARISFNQ